MTTIERYHYRKKHGMCVHCGITLPPRWGWTLCMKCREAQREAQRNWHNKVKEEERAEKTKTIKPTKPAKSLDEMSIESKEKHLTYGQLQKAEIIAKIRGED